VILVDTSAWVDFFRGRGRLCDRVDEALGAALTRVERARAEPLLRVLDSLGAVTLSAIELAMKVAPSRDRRGGPAAVPRASGYGVRPGSTQRLPAAPPSRAAPPSPTGGMVHSFEAHSSWATQLSPFRLPVASSEQPPARAAATRRSSFLALGIICSLM
jgi:hypothetical protein